VEKKGRSRDLEEDGDVNVENVSLEQWAEVGDAVRRHVVHCNRFYQSLSKRRTGQVFLVFLSFGGRWFTHYKIVVPHRGNKLQSLKCIIINSIVDIKICIFGRL
jgi:hypothetical protein